MVQNFNHLPRQVNITEEELANEWFDLPEIFITPNNYQLTLSRLFANLYLLIQDIHPEEVSRLVNEVNRIYRFYDISELVNDRLVVYSDADLSNVFGDRRLADIKIYDKDIYQFMNGIMQYLINVTLENRLYLSQFPDINYRFNPKSRICYSIGSYYFNRWGCSIVLYRQNPWRGNDHEWC